MTGEREPAGGRRDRPETRDPSGMTPGPTDPTGPAPDVRPLADRPHGAVRDPAHAEFYDIAHRNLPDPEPDEPGPERRLVVDDYASQVHGAGSRTQHDLGGAPPDPGTDDARDRHGEAEPGST